MNSGAPEPSSIYTSDCIFGIFKVFSLSMDSQQRAITPQGLVQLNKMLSRNVWYDSMTIINTYLYILG
jgi:hypothetical protein